MPEKKIDDFPSILEIEEHIQNRASQNRSKIPWTWWVMIVLAVLIIGLVAAKIGQSNPVIFQNVKGSVSGIVVNQMATPVAADVFLLKSNLSTTADKNGSFVLSDIPSGTQKIIVAYDGMGHEIPVNIEAGKTVDLGQIQVETTQIAPVH